MGVEVYGNRSLNRSLHVRNDQAYRPAAFCGLIEGDVASFLYDPVPFPLLVDAQGAWCRNLLLRRIHWHLQRKALLGF